MQQRQYSDNELFGIIQEVYFGATSWEQGRQAALRGRTLSDNPETPDTISYDEWKKGFVHGAVYDVPQSGQIEEIVMVGILPVIEVQVLPARSFWAVLNNLQIDLHLSVPELARRIGLAEERLCAGMIMFGFYDSDAIPMYDRVAV
ncbi:hypothetical protein OFL75_18300 [Pseudomonas aeruginosa]|jgi:hypothetical protein|uniref:AsnC family protein n=3 Tax=Pseudomonas TaxID=286 RepID=A0A2R3J588_9PSED|nr:MULTISPECIES: hypothetical protein [Pseudomonas]AVK09286.1 hypothetical protein CSB93_6867 [Pseudomonas paraeruginosa]AWE95692.1 hypothetical protein CSC28_6570 [Pseudomonas paraeruginosa]ELS0923262.1 hypothetical protein [Pseudomonas putida]ERV72809.1 hypothetical protein Q041_06051 [Pseudomonas aeruginosa BWHPSA028]KSH23504.1 hypothetical protein AO963_14615 [Pseudomonas aeruginosa]